MNQDLGFTDLRLNHQQGQNRESFWPSFTDIMTVIVMIFMLAMVVLLLRNIELVKQLRATMEAEREAVELARTTGEEKEDLALKLVATENELAMLRIQQMRLQEQNRQQLSHLGEREQTIATLEAERQDLTLRKQQLEARNYTLEQRMREAETRINSLQQNLATLKQDLGSTRQQLGTTQQQLAETRADLSGAESRYRLTRSELQQLQQRYQEQGEALQQSRAAERRSGEALAALKGQYSELKVKYDRLVRPARSPEGRYLVEVRYSKRNGQFVIEHKSPGQSNYQRISRQQLEQRLAQLKQEHSEGLYIKDIVPKESGLSFSEAWSFTSQLQGRYDYYSQDGGPQPIPVPATTE